MYREFVAERNALFLLYIFVFEHWIGDALSIMEEGYQLENIILIGMPGCGKSTVGVLLAKALGLDFVDTDVVLQAKEKRRLQEIIDDIGIDGFLKKEEEAILSLRCSRTVIATGGSVVYGKRAMDYLSSTGRVVYIKLPYEEIERRLSNLATRGVTLRKGQTLLSLYHERIPLYESAAQITFDASFSDIDATVRGIESVLTHNSEV